MPAEGSNPRVHDIYDILLLAGILDNKRLDQTRAACEDTFTHRAKHAWPPALPAWDDWEQLWNALDVPDYTRYPYTDASQRLQQLIQQIADA